jgi:hypothetical protein
VTAVLKSLAAAIIGMALFFSFFMMFSIPVLMFLQRSQNSSIIEPVGLFRAVGLPLSAVAFVICFGLALKKFRKTSSQPSPVGRR